MSEAMLDRTEIAAVVLPQPPVILFCDGALAGSLPGFEKGESVYLLNDTAWTLCQGLNLNATKIIEDSELPATYGTLIDKRSANDGRRF